MQLRLSCRHDRFSFVINKRSAAFRINERGMKEGGRTFDWNCTKVPRHTQCFDSHILISTHTPTFELSVENEKILHFVWLGRLSSWVLFFWFLGQVVFNQSQGQGWGRGGEDVGQTGMKGGPQGISRSNMV